MLLGKFRDVILTVIVGSICFQTSGEGVSNEDSSDEADAKPSSISLRRSARKRRIDVSEEQEERKKIKVELKVDRLFVSRYCMVV